MIHLFFDACFGGFFLGSWNDDADYLAGFQGIIVFSQFFGRESDYAIFQCEQSIVLALLNVRSRMIFRAALPDDNRASLSSGAVSQFDAQTFAF